jgi:hypothetical protein
MAGVEVNAKKIKYMFVFRQQNVGKKHYLLIANKSFANVVKFKYLKRQKQIKFIFTEKLRTH